MPTVDDLLADARLLSPDERRRLIASLQDSLQMDVVEEPTGNWTRDLWEDSPEFRVGAAQAISIREVQRRLAARL